MFKNFVGCYKQVMSTQKRELQMQHHFNCKTYFQQDEHKKFTFEDAWRLLKDDHKCLVDLPKYYAKRIFNSISRAYSSSFNLLCTHTSIQYNPLSLTLLHRPIDQKTVKINEIKKSCKNIYNKDRINVLQD